ncbi:MAG: TonB-dependent receptor, partial [Novosphingobium sp.]
YYRPLYNIERVEVLKGANALLFGRGGGGGVINRVSKAPQFESSRGRVAASGDSFGAWSASGDLNQPLGMSAAVRLNATYEEFRNHRDIYEGHFAGLAPTATVRLGEATTLTAAYEYVEDRRVTERGVPSFAGAPIVGFEDTFFGNATVNRSELTAHLGRLRLDHEFGENLRFTATGAFAHYDKFYGNILPGAVNAARTTVSLSGYRSSTERTNWTGQANLVWTGATGPLKHTLLAGIEASDQATHASRDDARFGAASSVTVPLALRIMVPANTWLQTSASRSDVRALSGYVQDQVEIGEHVQLVAGARYDDFEITATNLIGGAVTGRSDGKWSPRLGLIVKPMASLSLYASYAKSFLPQSGDQFTTLAANLQTLAPESFRNLEAGVKWDLSPALAFTAAAFQLDRNNTRATSPVDGSPVLTGSSRTKGLEVALTGELLPEWHATLGYTLQDGEIRTTTTAAPAGRKLDKLPRHQFTAWTRYDISGDIGVGLGVVHQSSTFATISNAVRLPGFTRIDAALFFDVSESFAVQLNVENLTDTAYFPTAHTDNNISVGKPLSARLTARLKF